MITKKTLLNALNTHYQPGLGRGLASIIGAAYARSDGINRLCNFIADLHKTNTSDPELSLIELCSVRDELIIIIGSSSAGSATKRACLAIHEMVKKRNRNTRKKSAGKCCSRYSSRMLPEKTEFSTIIKSGRDNRFLF